MYKKISQQLTALCIANKTIDIQQKEVYEYGFEILISNILYTLIFFTTALVTSTFFNSLCFWFAFIIVRKTSGGFHAKTYIKCHLMFFANHILFILALNNIPDICLTTVGIIEIIFSIILIFTFAPVDHPNKPFINNEEKKYRQLSIGYSIFLSVFMPCLCLMPLEIGKFIFSYGFGTISAAISAMSAKILKGASLK